MRAVLVDLVLQTLTISFRFAIAQVEVSNIFGSRLLHLSNCVVQRLLNFISLVLNFCRRGLQSVLQLVSNSLIKHILVCLHFSDGSAETIHRAFNILIDTLLYAWLNHPLHIFNQLKTIIARYRNF